VVRYRPQVQRLLGGCSAFRSRIYSLQVLNVQREVQALVVLLPTKVFSRYWFSPVLLRPSCLLRSSFGSAPPKPYRDRNAINSAHYPLIVTIEKKKRMAHVVSVGSTSSSTTCARYLVGTLPEHWHCGVRVEGANQSHRPSLVPFKIVPLKMSVPYRCPRQNSLSNASPPPLSHSWPLGDLPPILFAHSQQ
jgi:hypothetical protein